MLLPWVRVLQLLQCGTVLYDSQFRFPDGTTKPKWIVLLTGLLENSSYVYCLTTTQLQTYKGSYSTHLACRDEALGGKKNTFTLQRRHDKGGPFVLNGSLTNQVQKACYLTSSCIHGSFGTSQS